MQVLSVGPQKAAAFATVSSLSPFKAAGGAAAAGFNRRQGRRLELLVGPSLLGNVLGENTTAADV